MSNNDQPYKRLARKSWNVGKFAKLNGQNSLRQALRQTDTSYGSKPKKSKKVTPKKGTARIACILPCDKCGCPTFVDRKECARLERTPNKYPPKCGFWYCKNDPPSAYRSLVQREPAPL